MTKQSSTLHAGKAPEGERLALVALRRQKEQALEIGALRATVRKLQALEGLRDTVRELEAHVAKLAAEVAPSPVDAPCQGLVDQTQAAEIEARGMWTTLLGQGESVRTGWVADGKLVGSTELANSWGRTRQALDAAVRRGELFSLKVGKNRHYPAVFMALEVDAVKAVCLALKGDDATGKFVFWMRRHGALNAKTVAEAIADGRLDKAVSLARDWSVERGYAA